jgi:hypothetical protein
MKNVVFSKVDEKNVVKFKKNNSWVCFNQEGDVWVEEYNKIKKSFDTVCQAMCWVNDFGDRD